MRYLPLFAIVALCSAGCGQSGSERHPAAAGTQSTAGHSALRFVDVTATSGIALENVSGDPHEKLAIPESLGQGAAALDYDGDGLLDLFIANGDVFEGTPQRDGRPALYRNLGNLRFADVTAEAGLSFQGWGHGASRVDFDADDHPDLYVTIYRGPNRFFRNRGDGSFEDVSTSWGGADRGPSTAAVFFDADGDGDLDLYVANYVAYDPDDPPNDGKPCEWRGLQVLCGPKGTTPSPDRFYENRNGSLFEATAAFGFAEVEPLYALGAIAGDLDNDGDMDLYVANDSEVNYLFENQGRGRFLEVAALRGTDRNDDGRAQAGMGVDCGDLDNDGRFDLFVTNFSHDTNTLYRNLVTSAGEMIFEDATYAVKLGLESYRYLSWGTRIVDLDQDGWQDIVLVSGHVYPQVDRAPIGTAYRQRNQVFRNLGLTQGGKLAFREVEPTGGAFEKREASRGLVVADLDNDGDSDLLVVEMDGPPTLIRNDTLGQGHWIGFVLRDRGQNIDAIGARIVVQDSAGVLRWRERSAGGSYLSTGDPRILVGLGPAAGTLHSVEVSWPSGSKTMYADLEPDRYWLLKPGTDFSPSPIPIPGTD